MISTEFDWSNKALKIDDLGLIGFHPSIFL
jgi:hypothetical protein